MTPVTIHVDGRAHEVDPSQNLLAALLGLSYDVPYFCWHPALGSIGACRQCAVKVFRDEADTRGRIVMSCMTSVAAGQRVSVDDAEARAFRAQVIEWLMLNHPHDCPVCDEGGECHLQDMTVMTGHAYRRSRHRKRTWRNQDLGPCITHEMNRCIQCYRCVRLYRDHAGGTDLEVFGAHDRLYFGRRASGALESQFSGNLVEVCPTGVFTDKTLAAHYVRKWDQQMAPSICVHCGLGCNTTPCERGGTLRRVLNRYNHEVNGYFICDRGRFGYEFANGDRRLREARVHGVAGLRPAPAADALARALELLRGADRVVGIGSPRATLETNFALRALVGPEAFSIGLSGTDAALAGLAIGALQKGGVPAATIREAGVADAVLVLGEDVAATAPRLALALRQAALEAPAARAAELGLPRWHDGAIRDVVQDDRGPFFVATPGPTWLDAQATRTLRAAPDDLARLGLAVESRLAAAAPAGRDDALASEVADALAAAARPLVVSGTGCGSPAVVAAAARVAWALRRRGRDARLALVVPEVDTAGAVLLGGAPVEQVLGEIGEGERVVAVVAENDLHRRLARARLEPLLSKLAGLIAIDHVVTPTVEAAAVALPACAFAEATGTVVSGEGRAQRLFAAVAPEPPRRESWRWLCELAAGIGRHAPAGWERLDQVLEAMAAAVPALARAREAAPRADLRIDGRLVARQPPRASGRTALPEHLVLGQPRPPADLDSPLAFTMEGATGRDQPALRAVTWAPRWNSHHGAITKFQSEVGGPLRGGDPGVRLIEPVAAPAELPAGFDVSPEAFAPRPGLFLVVAAHHPFGTEELSAMAPAVAARMPAPHLTLNPADAAHLGIADGDLVELSLTSRGAGLSPSFADDAPNLDLPLSAEPERGSGGEALDQLRLPARLEPGLPAGLAQVPLGLAGVPWVELPAWASIERRGHG